MRFHAECRLFSFNTQPPEGGWASWRRSGFGFGCFNTQPPEGGWARRCAAQRQLQRFNTQPPEGGWQGAFETLTTAGSVSTHSRLKAAGGCIGSGSGGGSGFNTQPPEGGWIQYEEFRQAIDCFNTQPPEGGWHWLKQAVFPTKLVSTHSRLKAAGQQAGSNLEMIAVSTHSRLKAAGMACRSIHTRKIVSTHSRLKAAGQTKWAVSQGSNGFNTQPPEGGWKALFYIA